MNVSSTLYSIIMRVLPGNLLSRGGGDMQRAIDGYSLSSLMVLPPCKRSRVQTMSPDRITLFW